MIEFPDTGAIHLADHWAAFETGADFVDKKAPAEAEAFQIE